MVEIEEDSKKEETSETTTATIHLEATTEETNSNLQVMPTSKPQLSSLEAFHTTLLGKVFQTTSVKLEKLLQLESLLTNKLER